jgi:hypothetical protein
LTSETTVCKPLALFSPQRLDLVVKWRLFRHWINGSYPSAEEDYLWHIDQRQGANQIPLGIYVPKAWKLYNAMKNDGFNPAFAVPVNVNGIILGGAHRTACAAALGIDMHIEKLDTEHQWPDWGKAWFLSHGMDAELPGIMEDHARLTENFNG